MIIVELASVLIFIWQPLLGSIIILIIWCVAYIIPVPTPSTYIAAGLMAIGVIGYINLILSICIAGLFIGLKLGISAIPALEIPYPTATFTFMLLMTMITCAALGCIVRLLQQQRREQEYLRQQEQQRSIAADLHDSACNDLTYALLCLRESDSSLVDTHTLHNYAVEAIDTALESIHDSIRVLKQPKNDETTHHSQTLHLQSLIEASENRLRAVGFSGTSIINLPTDSIEADSCCAIIIIGMVRELFGNILKYADKTYPYVITVGIHNKTLQISVCDRPSKNLTIESLSSGMEFYRNRIEFLGGSMRMRLDNNLWLLDVSVPLSGNTK